MVKGPLVNPSDQPSWATYSVFYGSRFGLYHETKFWKFLFSPFKIASFSWFSRS